MTKDKLYEEVIYEAISDINTWVYYDLKKTKYLFKVFQRHNIMEGGSDLGDEILKEYVKVKWPDGADEDFVETAKDWVQAVINNYPEESRSILEITNLAQAEDPDLPEGEEIGLSFFDTLYDKLLNW